MSNEETSKEPRIRVPVLADVLDDAEELADVLHALGKAGFDPVVYSSGIGNPAVEGLPTAMRQRGYQVRVSSIPAPSTDAPPEKEN